MDALDLGGRCGATLLVVGERGEEHVEATLGLRVYARRMQARDIRVAQDLHAHAPRQELYRRCGRSGSGGRGVLLDSFCRAGALCKGVWPPVLTGSDPDRDDSQDEM
jgi:hypothetical protein